ncbi:MAG: hypothetical protein OTJ43_04765 [Dehalococcoidia bacterium]|nr:hypothetical protein [Dehalococcoidia bacterium]
MKTSRRIHRFQLKVLKSYVSPSTGEALPFGIDTYTQSNENKPSEEDDMYSGACFDLVAAALADISGSASTIESERIASLRHLTI